LLTLTREYLAGGEFTTLLKETASLNTSEILAAARRDDPLALAVFDEIGSHLGIIMGVCVAVLNPAMFIIGGGLGLAAFDLMVPAAHRELEQRVISSSYQELKIVPSCLTSSAVGPSCLVWYGLNSRQ
jgi:predicted NBD/HSP70 family sugar kinase